MIKKRLMQSMGHINMPPGKEHYKPTCMLLAECEESETAFYISDGKTTRCITKDFNQKNNWGYHTASCDNCPKDKDDN